MLNELGNLVDLLSCGQLSGNIQRSLRNATDVGSFSGPLTDARKATDLQRLKDKILERKPHAIVVSQRKPCMRAHWWCASRQGSMANRWQQSARRGRKIKDERLGVREP